MVSDVNKIKPPMQYENVKNTLSQSSVNTYDGFRVMVQKQINLNTVVSHFYWLGSQNTQQPVYQYRLILPLEDETFINVATDMDFNIEGEVKKPINQNILAKSNFVISEQQGRSISLELEVTDECSASQFKYTKADDNQYQVAYMQSITPFFTMGGMGVYSTKENSLQTAYALIYDPQDYTLAAQYDQNIKFMYMRRVNPNRVHVSTDLAVDPATGGSTMSVSAEFMLKQSKLHLGVDSNLLLKSYLETSLSQGTQLQLAAEMQQHAGHYRFGMGIVMG